MNVLANALPGLRELRAPLVAGYLWLILVWFLLHPAVTEAGDKPAVLQALIELRETTGGVAFAIGVSVAAYLVGSVSQAMTNWIPSRGGRIRRTWLFRRLGFAGPAPEEALSSSYVGTLPTPDELVSERLPDAVLEVQRSFVHSAPLRAALEEEISRTFKEETGVRSKADLLKQLGDVRVKINHANQAGDKEGAEQLRQVANRLIRVRDAKTPLEVALWELDEAIAGLQEELRQHASRAATQLRHETDLPVTLLIGEDDRLYMDAERVRAEGELRLAVAPPLTAASILAAVEVHPLWTLAIGGIVILFTQGLQRIRIAKGIVSTGIRFGTAQSAALRDFDAARRKVLERAAELDQKFTARFGALPKSEEAA